MPGWSHRDGNRLLSSPGCCPRQAADGRRASGRVHGARRITRLTADGIELTSLGDVHDDAAAETATITDSRGGRYARVLVRDDRIVGAVLLGLPRAAASIAHLFDSEAPVPTDPLDLLVGAEWAEPRPNTTADPMVCHCNGVTRGRIESAWAQGIRTRADVARTTYATTGCGGCAGDVDTLLSEWSGAVPGAAR
ncbi:(2Fe-2S)-binding protein [Streptomonospora algeriensis]|uniref:(2Fe-2S)-binding protein n=1 Tax=Streptomonospora algeriensis TaxID=995084 RepID=A0ABW3BAV0_9ACTN